MRERERERERVKDGRKEREREGERERKRVERVVKEKRNKKASIKRNLKSVESLKTCEENHSIASFQFLAPSIFLIFFFNIFTFSSDTTVFIFNLL